MSFAIRVTGGRVILIHVAKQNGYESCLLFSPEERNVKNVNKENARGMQDDTISKRQAIDALEKWLHGLFGITEADGTATIFKTIKQLPPIQPEIVRCKDCRKHNKKLGFDENYNLTYKDDACPLIPWRGMSRGHEHDYQSCCLGERKEVNHESN